MKYDAMANIVGSVLNGLVKKDISDKKVRKEIKAEYKAVIERASDIGNKNFLIMSYYLAAYFIGMNRKDGMTPEENIAIMEKAIRNSKLVPMTLGNAKQYLSEKKMVQRRKWAEETHKRKYKNDWVVDVLEKTDDYEFGLDYTKCGVCELCRDEGCFELAKYQCSLDYMLVDLIGVHLDRTMVLAEGCPKCDFRFKKIDDKK